MPTMKLSRHWILRGKKAEGQLNFQKMKIGQVSEDARYLLDKKVEITRKAFGLREKELDDSFKLQTAAMGKATKLRLSSGPSRKAIQQANQSLVAINSSPSAPGGGSLALTDQSGESDGAVGVIANRPDTSSPGRSYTEMYDDEDDEDNNDIDLDQDGFREHEKEMKKMENDQETYKMNLEMCNNVEEVAKINEDKNKQELAMYEKSAAQKLAMKKMAIEMRKMELEERRMRMQEKRGVSTAPTNPN